MWDLWCTKLYWGGVFTEWFNFSLPVLFHQCPVFVFDFSLILCGAIQKERSIFWEVIVSNIVRIKVQMR